MKLYGSLFANPAGVDQPLVFVPVDGGNAELLLIHEIPQEPRDQLSAQADALDLLPLGLIIDLSGAK